MAMGKTRVHLADPGAMSEWRVSQVAETPIEALMQCRPFDEPAESRLEHEVKVEGLRTAMDLALDDRERWVIESIFYRRRGIRLLAQELSLSKTHIARLRDQAFQKLAAHMEAAGTAPEFALAGDTTGGTEE